MKRAIGCLRTLVCLVSILAVPACQDFTRPSDVSSLIVIAANATTKDRVPSATAQTQGKTCTTNSSGTCTIGGLPLTTISVTITHPDYLEVKRDVAMAAGILNGLDVELQPK